MTESFAILCGGIGSPQNFAVTLFLSYESMRTQPTRPAQSLVAAKPNNLPLSLKDDVDEVGNHCLVVTLGRWLVMAGVLSLRVA